MLFESFIARIDNASDPTVVAAARRAAELVALGEALRAKAIRGEAVDLANMIKIENLGARAARALKLDYKREPSSSPSLNEYLKSLPPAGEAAE